MALTISTGFVVDDAIVMIENIVRFIEDGRSPLRSRVERRASRSASRSFRSASRSSPSSFRLLFMTGIVGRLFREFAITLSVAVVGLRRRLADLDADDVRQASQARREEEKKHGRRFYQCTGGLFRRHARICTNAG